MTEVESFLKESGGYGPCQCTNDLCELDGRLGKPDRDNRRHVVGCSCNPCRGRRNRRKGDRKALKARKALNIAGANSRHEEVWSGSLRVEVKAGAQVRPAVTAFEKARAQSEAARPVGDTRVFAAVLMPDGQRDGIFACQLSDVYEVALAVLENQAVDAVSRHTRQADTASGAEL